MAAVDPQTMAQPEEIVVYFNPNCSKSRAARDLLQERGSTICLIDYQQNPPSRAELTELLAKLETGATSLLRAKDPRFHELGLAGASDDQLLDALVAHPELLERPIVVRGARAVIARPPERLHELFGD